MSEPSSCLLSTIIVNIHASNIFVSLSGRNHIHISFTVNYSEEAQNMVNVMWVPVSSICRSTGAVFSATN